MTPKQILQQYQGGKYKDMTIVQFCKLHNVSPKAFSKRLSRGASVEQALNPAKRKSHGRPEGCPNKTKKVDVKSIVANNKRVPLDKVVVPFEESDLDDNFKQWYTQEIKSFAKGVYAKFPISLTACMLGFTYDYFLKELKKYKTIVQIIKEA